MIFQKINNTILSLPEINSDRKQLLDEFSNFIQEKKNRNEIINLNFICTHNSRRSHLSQIWAQTLADYFNIDNVFCYSGGTEATAMFPKVKETLEKQGFQIEIIGNNVNPIYSVKFSEIKHPVICFSKKYDASFNPPTNFAAIMTCSSADEGCPIIFGAEKRFPIKYDDPKAFDNSDLMDQKYLERSKEIASEMKYVFSKVIPI